MGWGTDKHTHSQTYQYHGSAWPRGRPSGKYKIGAYSNNITKKNFFGGILFAKESGGKSKLNLTWFNKLYHQCCSRLLQ